MLDSLDVEAQIAPPLVLIADERAAIHDAGRSKRPIDINGHVAALHREHLHFLKAELAVCRFAFASEIHQGVHRRSALSPLSDCCQRLTQIRAGYMGVLAGFYGRSLALSSKSVAAI